ncbi:MAG TPA: PLP-dependent aminotransferase family protein [Thermoanaerobaculia bacterium]|nr:PLP-dependent aminotransferase family protein [Thermoanaerobaculia bacterium]HRS35553.1 PLP-dependent aminotransferase family protein [Thermoanaerobaculia bacterium]HRU09683.1 PLP-dependent aminotransferase family protein [Thermoanaerobaculia bacterium]
MTNFVPTPWIDRFAARTERMTSSAIRELLKLTADPEVISFAGGLPAPDVFPLEQIDAACRKVIAEQGKAALQYSTTEGYLPLRELLCRHMERYGIKVTPANVLVTGGSQQALDLIGKLMINPGDRVLTEAPTYLGALQAWSGYETRYLTVPLDDDGLRTDELEAQLRSGPKYLYILPNFHNPGGTTMTVERRHRLVELASHYGTPILEDDPYGQLRFEGDHLPTLVEIDAQYHGATTSEHPFRGGVMYLGTLSKTLAPGLRIGWVVAPEAVIQKLVQIKQGADLHTATFTQMVAYEAATGGFLDRHVKRIREVYGERRNVMLAALEKHLPPGCHWTRPQGGLFLWVTLPEGANTDKLIRDALEQKVAFVPGSSFYPLGGGQRSMRLNFSYCNPEKIEEGVRRLGNVVARHLAPKAVAVP